MTKTAIATSRHGTVPTFRNALRDVVQPVCFAIVYWEGPGDTLYAFEDRAAFDRQRASAERNFAHVLELTADEAADWIVAGGKAVLLQISDGGGADLADLKLAFE